MGGMTMDGEAVLLRALWSGLIALAISGTLVAAGLFIVPARYAAVMSGLLSVLALTFALDWIGIRHGLPDVLWSDQQTLGMILTFLLFWCIAFAVLTLEQLGSRSRREP